jgi:hypothetical protein
VALWRSGAEDGYRDQAWAAVGRKALPRVAAAALAAATPGSVEAALDSGRLALTAAEASAAAGAAASANALDMSWPEARPVPRPDQPDEIEVSFLDPGPMLHGLLVPPEDDRAKPPQQRNALAGMLWLGAFLITLAVSAGRLELRSHARRSAWTRRVSGYDA